MGFYYKNAQNNAFLHCFYKDFIDEYACNFVIDFDWQTDNITMLFDKYFDFSGPISKNIPCLQRSPVLGA